MRRKGSGLLLLLMVFVVFAVPGRTESYRMQLTAATANAADEVGAVVLTEFQRLVQERTNGHIKVTLHLDGVLGSDQELIKGLQRGTVDLITCSAFKYAEYVPEFMVLELPFLFFSTEHLQTVLAGTLGEVLKEKAQKNRGDYLLGYITDGPVNIVSNRALVSLSQGRGLRFRLLLLPTHRQTWETLSITPVTLAYSEFKIGLQVGMVDAVETNFIDYKKMRVYDTARFILQSEHYFPVNLIMLSKTAWHRIPQSYRKVVQECAQDAIAFGSIELLWQNRETARELTEKYGVRITQLSLAEKKNNHQKLVAYQEKTFSAYGLKENWPEVRTTYQEYQEQLEAEQERIRQSQEKEVQN
ncbi:MAG: TRAP transporter substrate-binding protein [Firmicutes bacterium]|nr:TRAP transporter substrate-binding protein [Bacillota bacterium]